MLGDWHVWLGGERNYGGPTGGERNIGTSDGGGENKLNICGPLL